MFRESVVIEQGCPVNKGRSLMVWEKDERVYTWNDLEHAIAQEVPCAPGTAGDSTGSWREAHGGAIGYVMRNVVGKSRVNHLTLIAAVFAAQRRSVSTVEGIVRMLHVRFSSLFPLFDLADVRQWSIDQHLASYMRGKVLSHDPPATRVAFFKRSMSATNLVAAWLDFLPTQEQEVYQPFLLPTVNPFLAELLY